MPVHIPPYAGIYIEILDRIHGPQWLPQVSLSSHSKLHHTASHTLLTQTFINPSSTSPIPSAKYTFPLYESCAVVAFRCHIGRRQIEGVIQEKEDASATYQAAIGRNQQAGLLEQHTTDVFTTSIGNIPAGETVKVEIEYIMELKHDAEVDGLRFTIPTSIAPRYGTLPTGLSPGDLIRAATAKSMNISVQVTMSSSIKSIQSPSHPISLYLGGHTTDTPDDAFNQQHALATLGQTSTELDKDFILLIKCANLSSPAALLEAHPSIPNSNALMVTLVPKFNLPNSSKPEVVFIVDRSGSMNSKVAPLKSSLSVFLKSLPLDVNFNICSFGSSHSFLWNTSKPYSNQSFAEAQRYCDQMQADLGGTEILPAIKSTIEKRLNDLNLEIMLLTDGQVWNSELLFKYVEKETEKGDVRLFSLGIGRDVSHALVDGLARVGRGFSQVVMDEREGMESKVARMLRGALSAHVVNYRLEWEGKPSVEAVQRNTTSNRAIRHISLFDSQANTDSPVSFSSPSFTIPSVIQAPYKIPPLFPFSRTTAYALLSSDARPPSHVWLRGTTPEGDQLELEIPVQQVVQRGKTIHQLAARKVLQELKDGTSYVHGAVDGGRLPGLLEEWVRKEGVRVGLKYGVASQWTSFVAVERKEEEVVQEEEEKMEEVQEEERRDQREVQEPQPSEANVLDSDEDWDNVTEPTVRDSDDEMNDGRSLAGRYEPQIMMMAAPPPPPIQYPTKAPPSFLFPKDSSKTTKKSDYLSSAPTFDSYSDLSSTNTLGSVTPPPAEAPVLKTKRMMGRGLSSLTADSTSSNPAMPMVHNQSKIDTKAAGQSAASFRGRLSSPLFGRGRGGAASPSSVSQHQSSFGSSSVASPSSPGAAPGGVSESDTKPTMDKRSFFSSFSRFSMPKSPSAAPSSSPVSGQSLFGSLSAAGAPSSDTSPSGSFAGADSDVMFKALASRQEGLQAKLVNHQSKKEMSGSSNNIGISYSPVNAPPPERLTSDTGAQPLSSQTKTLIGLQTFEGCFILDRSLASLLGVSLSALEAKLSLAGNQGFSVEQAKKVWATVLAIKLFETRLAGERGVWQLVMDKARVWMGGVVGVDVALLEKMAGEVLGV